MQTLIQQTRGNHRKTPSFLTLHFSMQSQRNTNAMILQGSISSPLGRVFKVCSQTSEAWVGIWGQPATASSVTWPAHLSTTKPTALARTWETPGDATWCWGQGLGLRTRAQNQLPALGCNASKRAHGFLDQKPPLTRVFWQIKYK